MLTCSVGQCTRYFYIIHSPSHQEERKQFMMGNEGQLQSPTYRTKEGKAKKGTRYSRCMASTNHCGTSLKKKKKCNPCFCLKYFTKNFHGESKEEKIHLSASFSLRPEFKNIQPRRTKQSWIPSLAFRLALNLVWFKDIASSEMHSRKKHSINELMNKWINKWIIN